MTDRGAGAAPPGKGRQGKGFVRQSATSSVAALLALLTGLLLDISISVQFGAGRQSDAFFAASRIPIGVTAMLMTIAVQAWVPQFVRERAENGAAGLSTFASRMCSATTLVGLGVWALAWAFARPIIEVTAPGLSAYQIGLAASMVPLMFLVVPLVAAAETVRGALNASHSFVLPAAMNIAMNLPAAVLILVAGRDDIHLVAWAYVIGAGLQLLAILVVAWVHGLRIVPSWHLRDARVIRAMRFTGRPSLSSGLNLANRTAEQAIASFLPAGSITVLSYAQRLISALGGGTFFRPITVALIPRLADAEHAGDDAKTTAILYRAVRLVIGVALTLTTFTVALAGPAIGLAFHRGNFSAEKAHLLALTLAVYGASLVGSGLQRVLLAPFFARLDTRTPLRNTVYGVVIDLVLLLPCMALFGIDSTYGVLGVAVAYSIDQYVICAHAWFRLRRDLPVRVGALTGFTVRALAVAGIGTAVMGALVQLSGVDDGGSQLRLLIRTTSIAAAGALTLAVASFALAGPRGRATLLRRTRSAPAGVPPPPDASTGRRAGQHRRTDGTRTDDTRTDARS